MAVVPRLVNAVFPNFKDTMGGQANGMWTARDQSDGGFGPYSGLIAATQALTVSGLFGAVLQTRSLIPVTPDTGPYGTVRDQVVMVVQSENQTGQIAIPAPIEGIFVSGSANVDLTNGLVVSWWDEVQGVLGDSYGGAWTTLSYGYRRKIKIGDR